MKKFNLSLVAILAVGTMSFSQANNGIYFGIGYSGTGIDVDGFNNGGITLDSTSGFVVQSGFKINPYIAIEGRYWNGDNNLDAWGLYAKPMYPVNHAFDVYGIVGYGNASTQPDEYTDISLDDSSLQWGLGAEYSFNDNLSVFVDYIEMYNDEIVNLEWSMDTVNVGLTYQF